MTNHYCPAFFLCLSVCLSACLFVFLSFFPSVAHIVMSSNNELFIDDYMLERLVLAQDLNFKYKKLKKFQFEINVKFLLGKT